MDWTITAPIIASFIGALLSALCIVLWFLLVRLITQVDKLGTELLESNKQQNAAMAEMASLQLTRSNTVDTFIRTELRTLDVRISVLETIWKSPK